MFYDEDRVLVAVMNNQRDFEIAAEEGWYRIPSRHAPLSTTEAVALGFYFTRAFAEEKWAIHWYAPILGHELVRRRDLLPAEPDHPHANEIYYKLQLGRLRRLEFPIYSLRWRRITFIETTWDRFTAAEEINDLYASGADGLFVTLKEMGLHPEREFRIREGEITYIVDLAIPCQQGTVTLCLDEDVPTPPGALRQADPEAIRQAVERLGGEQTAQMGDMGQHDLEEIKCPNPTSKRSPRNENA